MCSLRPALALVIALIACGPAEKVTRSETKVPPDKVDDVDEVADAAVVVKLDARTAPRDTGSAPRLDTAPANEPDTAPDPFAADAGASEDAGPSPDTASATPDTRAAGPEGGTAGPVTEAMWSHTMCNQAALMFPNIDKNMGRFPPGSCPPPQTLARPCGGNSKIEVVKATSSPYETGYVHPPEYAVDEHIMTRWSSNTGPTAWLAMDLGSEQTFQRLYLAWELAHGTDYDIVTSADGQNWTTLKQVRGGNGYQDIVDVEGKARHVRINGVNRGRTGGQLYGYSLFDVVICGERP